MSEETAASGPDIGAAVADLCAIGGAGLVSYGAWLIFPPAGFIVGGMILLAFGSVAVLSRRSAVAPRRSTKVS